MNNRTTNLSGEKAQGEVKHADTPAGQLPATQATSEFSVATSRNTQKHGLSCFLESQCAK